MDKPYTKWPVNAYRGFLPGQSTFTFYLFTGPPPEDCVNDTGEPVMELTIDDGRTVQTFYISEAEFREYYDKFDKVAKYLQWKENQETLRDLLLDE